MDALAKLLKRSSRKDQESILNALHEIKDPSIRNTLDIKKLTDKDFYRVRKGKFRIIFHLEGERAIIDAVKLRNEKPTSYNSCTR